MSYFIPYNMPYHSILENQIERFLPAGLLSNPELAVFLETVSKCYESSEKDKKITEHAFDISEREYQLVTRDLQRENEIREQSILKLKEAIRSLDPEGSIEFGEQEGDIINIITFLGKQIAQTKILEQELIN